MMAVTIFQRNLPGQSLSHCGHIQPAEDFWLETGKLPSLSMLLGTWSWLLPIRLGLTLEDMSWLEEPVENLNGHHYCQRMETFLSKLTVVNQWMIGQYKVISGHSRSFQGPSRSFQVILGSFQSQSNINPRSIKVTQGSFQGHSRSFQGHYWVIPESIQGHSRVNLRPI